MNWADYFIICVIGLSVMVGLWRGLVSELLALAVWVAAFWVAWTFGPTLAARLEHSISLPSARIIVGYVLCFVAVLVLGALLRFAVARVIAGIGLSGIDRLLGMLFGFARGVLLVALMVFLVGFTTLIRDPWYQDSVLLPQFRQAAVWLGQRVPADVGAHLHPQQVLEHLPRLQVPRIDPISASSRLQPAGSAPAPAASTAPAPASSVPAHRHDDRRRSAR